MGLPELALCHGHEAELPVAGPEIVQDGTGTWERWFPGQLGPCLATQTPPSLRTQEQLGDQLKKTTTEGNQCQRGRGERETLTDDGSEKRAATVEKSLEVSPQIIELLHTQQFHFWMEFLKAKTRLKQMCAHPRPQQRYSQEQKGGNTPASIDRWRSGHAAEYYSAMKRRDILTPTTMWVDPEDTVLSERSQAQKDKHCAIPLTGGPQRSQIHRDGE